MADDRNLHQQQHYSQYYAPIPMRIIHEYDFFADAPANKLKATHILPLPENPEALREFFVPQLVPQPRGFRCHKKIGKNRRQKIPHPMLIDTTAATSIRIFGVDFNVGQETAITSIDKGKEKMLHMGKSLSINIQGGDEDKNTRAAATNLGNPNVDHQEFRDILKLVDRSNLGLHDEQETAIRSINKGKEKILHMGESSINQAAHHEDKNTRMGNTEVMVMNADKIDTTAAATNLGSPNVDHQEIRDPKVVDRSNLGLHDDQGTAIGSINKGKEKMLHMRKFSIISQAAHGNKNTRTGNTIKGIIINEEKNTARNPTTNLKNPNLDHRRHHHCHDQEPNPPPFHPKILKEIREPPVFLFEKELECPDLHSGPNQLRILDATNMIRFTNREERSKLHNGGFVSVITREAQHAVKDHVLQLAKLEEGHDIVLVLRDAWLSVLSDLRLKLGDLVQGWGYRKDGQFRLVLNIVRVPPSTGTTPYSNS